MVTPCERATVLEVWMVGPSAMGSVKGMPNSMTSISSMLDRSIGRRRLGSQLRTSTASLHAEQDFRHERWFGESSSNIGHKGSLLVFISSVIAKGDGVLSVVPCSRPCNA